LSWSAENAAAHCERTSFARRIASFAASKPSGVPELIPRWASAIAASKRNCASCCVTRRSFAARSISDDGVVISPSRSRVSRRPCAAR
jgi:hypothetical protein